jgi:endonuclease/exonuclease/phosphatase family metal-dependent hydrolase
MKFARVGRSVLAVALSVVAGAAALRAAPTGSAQALPVKVMTFNIRTAMGRDGDNVWANRKGMVAETIRRYAPDVMGLQEALEEQIEYLDEALPEYRWLGVDRGLNGGTGLSEATPIFYRFDELSPIESGTFWLSGTPDEPSPGRRGARIVTWARFYHLATGRQLYVFNTHLTLRQGRQQVESAEQITSRVASLPPGTPVIVIGDFNATAGASETWDAATSGSLRDAWLIANQRHGPAVTYNGFAPPDEGANDRVDWILVGGPIEAPYVETVLYHEGSHYPSDHFPVFAELQIAE